MNNITELNEIIYVGVNLVCGKILVSSEEHKQRVKSWMGNYIGNTGKEPTITSKSAKTGEKYENMLGRTERRFTITTKDTNRRDKSEGTREKVRLNDSETGPSNTAYSKTTKDNSTSKQEENGPRHTNNLMRERQRDFGEKYGNWEILTKELNW